MSHRPIWSVRSGSAWRAGSTGSHSSTAGVSWKPKDYRRQMTETRAMLAELPDPDKLVTFDRNRRIMTSMAENVDRATRPQLQELVQLLVEGVTAKDRSVDPDSIEWTPPARPFFGEGALPWRPRTGSSPQQPRSVSGLLPRGRLTGYVLSGQSSGHVHLVH